jgi:hypothetical protein
VWRTVIGHVKSVENTNCQWHIERKFRGIFCLSSEVKFFFPSMDSEKSSIDGVTQSLTPRLPYKFNWMRDVT